jgi:hypothetical protein
MFEDFYLPFGGKLRSDNRWEKLSKLIPRGEIEEQYAGNFVKSWMGAPATVLMVTVGERIRIRGS